MKRSILCAQYANTFLTHDSKLTIPILESFAQICQLESVEQIIVQPVIAALPKAQERSAAPKTGHFGSFSILLDDFLDVMEAADAAISSECFYEECWFFALFMEKKGLIETIEF